MSQTVATTEITIVYDRPVARGRELFGGIVAYGEIWNPGANDATKATFSQSVTIDGMPLPAGDYSIWAIPDPNEWTVIFNRAADVYHEPYPGEEHEELRLMVTPESGQHMETLAFYFPAVEKKDAVLRLHWERRWCHLRSPCPRSSPRSSPPLSRSVHMCDGPGLPASFAPQVHGSERALYLTVRGRRAPQPLRVFKRPRPHGLGDAETSEPTGIIGLVETHRHDQLRNSSRKTRSRGSDAAVVHERRRPVQNTAQRHVVEASVLVGRGLGRCCSYLVKKTPLRPRRWQASTAAWKKRSA